MKNEDVVFCQGHLLSLTRTGKTFTLRTRLPRHRISGEVKREKVKEKFI